MQIKTLTYPEEDKMRTKLYAEFLANHHSLYATDRIEYHRLAFDYVRKQIQIEVYGLHQLPKPEPKRQTLVDKLRQARQSQNSS